MRKTTGELNVPIAAFIFASSGAAISLLQQQLYYAGAGDGSILILVLATFLGTILGGFSSSEARAELMPFHREMPRRMIQCIPVSLADVASLTLRNIAQNKCGSGMFTVIYASLPAFNGILSYFVLNRVLNRWQWLSMGIVVLGLALSAEAEEGELEERFAQKVALGITLGIAGTFFSSMSYICVELVLKSPAAPKEPGTVTASNGVNDLVIALPWLLGYSLPHRHELLYKPVIERGWSPNIIIFLWLCLMLANAAHLSTCYYLLQVTDSVTLTMLQGVRAVMVFLISGALFCSNKTPEQCLNIRKSLFSAMVIFGVILYARSTVGLSKTMSGTTKEHEADAAHSQAENGQHEHAK